MGTVGAARAKDTAATKTLEPKPSALSRLEEMKQDVDDVQKDMPQEDFENIKLISIF